ncbi:MAG: exopolysaccharide biosynthesis polyprenyl glycosylphosphotransferase [Oscillospiraceae bacterium]|nr:exopolysaccharide biosynthesis polyprenyl glycosylphosphotransferase [Oscillospiraceae bacterium]
MDVSTHRKSREKFKHNTVIQLLKLIDILFITLPFALCWYMYYADRIISPFYAKGNWVVILMFGLMYFVFVRTYDGLHISLYSVAEMIYSQVLAFLVSDLFIYIVICVLSKKIVNLLPGLACIGAQAILCTLWSWGANRGYYRMLKPQKTAIVYEIREGMEHLIQSYGLAKKYDVQLTVDVNECLANLSVLDSYQTVFLSGVRSHNRNIVLKYCIERGITLYIIPRVGDVLLNGSARLHLFHLPMLRTERYNPSPFYLFIKRFFDILVSAVAILVLSPLLVVVSIAIKANDGGPVLYKQKRLTRDAREFYVYKFRSMRVDAEKDGVARLSTGDKDDRITPVGRFIRKVRIDELPQLFNILNGDMSLVGPRPERPEIEAEYCKEMPEFHLRLQAKAGLTGYAQIYGKYNTTPYDKLIMDLMYISKPSLIEDIKIIFATVKILFLPESTEGIAEGQTTAAIAPSNKDK